MFFFKINEGKGDDSDITGEGGGMQIVGRVRKKWVVSTQQWVGLAAVFIQPMFADLI